MMQRHTPPMTENTADAAVLVLALLITKPTGAGRTGA
jgi:hypothetical protein